MLLSCYVGLGVLLIALAMVLWFVMVVVGVCVSWCWLFALDCFLGCVCCLVIMLLGCDGCLITYAVTLIVLLMCL